MEFCWVHEGVLVKDYNSKDFDLVLITKRFMKNQKARKVLVVLVAVGLIALDLIMASKSVACINGAGLDSLDRVGNELLRIAQRFGKWVFLVVSLFNVIKDGVQGGSKDLAFRTALKYLALYAALYAIPWLFNLIEGF